MDQEETVQDGQLSASTGDSTTQAADTSKPSPATQDYGKEQTGSETQSSSSTDESQKKEEAQVDIRAYEQMKGKVSKLQQEADVAQRLKEVVISSPEIYKTALMKTRGMSEAEADQTVEQVRRENPNLWQGGNTNQVQQPQAGIQPQKSATQAAMEAEYERKRDQFFAGFESKNDWINQSPNPDYIKKEIALSAADALRRNPRLSEEQAYDRASRVVREDFYPDEVSKSESESAEMRGMMKANNDASSDFSSTSSKSENNHKSTVSLTPFEERQMKLAGFKSKDEYLQYREESS